MAEKTEKANKRVIVVAMDGSKESDNALDFYMKNIHQDCDDVIIMHCVQHKVHYNMGSVWMPLDPQTITRAIVEERNKGAEMSEKLERLLEMYKGGGRLSVMKLDHGDPGPLIVAKAKECGASAIVMGSRGQGKIRRTVLGSVSDYILHHSDVPVLICRR